MIKAALEYLVGLGEANIKHENGQVFSDKELYLIEEPTPEELVVNSLSSLVEYIKSNFDDDDPVMVHVKSPTEVRCFSAVNGDMNRYQWISAKALLPTFQFDNWYDTETFNIKLQSCFVKNNDRDIMLKVVGNIKEETVNSIGDDGISQSVVAKTGVASVGNVKVPNPVSLKPYRTFVEIEQPESEFVFRMKSGPKCALFEADGGAWKLVAMKRIKDYLTDHLKTAPIHRKVFVIA